MPPTPLKPLILALRRVAGRSSLRSKRDPVLFRIKVGDCHFQSVRQFKKLEIRDPSNAAFDAHDNAPRHIPSPELANRSEFFLRPATFIPKQHHLAANNVSRGIHAPVHLSGFSLVIVWNSKQLVRKSRRYSIEIVAK